MLKDAEEHLQLAMQERSYYRSAIEISKEVLRQILTINGCLLVPPVGSCLPPLSWDVEMHFSLDMAQQVWRMQLSPVQTHVLVNPQVHYPSDPQQPGPWYFLTPHKCAIFGVCCEAIPRQVGGIASVLPLQSTCIIIHYLLQVNYLIDEAVNTGKGANNIISMLHHFLETHNFGEANLHLHCDNCLGQNKNRFVMQYLAWRVMVGRNKKITVSFTGKK